MSNHYLSYQQYCNQLAGLNKKRSLLPPAKQDNILLSHCPIDFTSNDYLKLSRHPEVIKSLKEYASLYGAGATGSRLLSGNLTLFLELEAAIAKSKNTESALIFSTGYQANSTVLPALLNQSVLKKKPIAFFDRLNHASLYHGCALAGAKLERYRHNDMRHLAKLLNKYDPTKYLSFIISETLFGMDGDIADMPGLINLAKQFNALLYLDEAHATGLFGKEGYGLSTLYDFATFPTIIMGTFSKAIGVSGAYIACSQIISEYLINKCGGFIYSTAPSPAVIGAVSKSWALIPTFNKERANIIAKAQHLREKLSKLGYNLGYSSNTHIVTIIMPSAVQAVQYQQLLRKKGIAVSAIRPPTAPTSRIRIAVNTSHTAQQIDILLVALCDLAAHAQG